MDGVIPDRILRTWRTSRVGCYLLNVLTRGYEVDELWRFTDPISMVMHDRSLSERRALDRGLR